MIDSSNRFGAAMGAVLISAALFASAAPSATAKTPTDLAACLSVPKGFSAPAVKSSAAPASLWKAWHYGREVTLSATPASALIDWPVTIRVSGLEPGEPVTLHASVSDYQRRKFAAQATFIANDQGVVNAARQAPVYGSYSGVHAMGLIWSMEPRDVKNPSAVYFIPAGDRYSVHLQAEAAGRVLASTTLSRYHRARGVTETIVKSNGLVGDFFRPAAPGLHPAVLVLGGSEGGLHPQVEEAALLAAHGYAALGLAYFQGFTDRNNPRLAKLPKSLADIPLEYFIEAANWLKRQPGVDSHQVAIMGWSKGAEAALITAATFPKDFQAAIAWMPSSVVWFGLAFGRPATSSWTLEGKPVPWVNGVMDQAALAKLRSGQPVAFTPLYAAGLKDSAAVRKAAIPVERIAGPVLLISAGDDQIWPSSVMARQVMQRLAAHHHPYRDESLCYAAAGHFILPPYRPTNASAFAFPGGGYLIGGTPIAYAFADVDSWHKVLAFLHAALR